MNITSSHVAFGAKLTITDAAHQSMVDELGAEKALALDESIREQFEDEFGSYETLDVAFSFWCSGRQSQVVQHGDRVFIRGRMSGQSGEQPDWIDGNADRRSNQTWPEFVRELFAELKDIVAQYNIL